MCVLAHLLSCILYGMVDWEQVGLAPALAGTTFCFCDGCQRTRTLSLSLSYFTFSCVLVTVVCGCASSLAPP